MAMPLTMTSATYGAAGIAAFGNALTGGYGSFVSDAVPTGSAFTAEFRFARAAVPAALQIYVAQTWAFSIGINTSGFAVATVGSDNAMVTLTGATNLADGLDHHVALTVDQVKGCILWVDGVAVFSTNITPQKAAVQYSRAKNFDVNSYRGSGSTTNDVSGSATYSVALWLGVRYTATFTPSITPYATNTKGLFAYWQLNSNGTDTKVAEVADGYTFVCGSYLAFNNACQIGVIANGNLAAPVVVTFNAKLINGVNNGTFSGTATLPAGAPVWVPITYTGNSSVGQRRITSTNNGSLTDPAAFDTQVISNAIKAPNSAGYIYNDGDWIISATEAKTINVGARCRTKLNGVGELTFDMTGMTAPLPQLQIRVDGGGWYRRELASAIQIEVNPFSMSTDHVVEFVVDAMTQTLGTWGPGQPGAVRFTGIRSSTTTAVVAPRAAKGKGMVLGDSISLGINSITIKSNVGGDVTLSSQVASWAGRLGELTDCDVTVVGFGAQGITTGGTVGVPAMPASWDSMWNGQARTPISNLDWIIWELTQNDVAVDTVAAGIGALNAQMAVYPNTMFYIMQPFNVAIPQATNLQAIVAGCSNPSMARFISTAGPVWPSSGSGDAVHPFAWSSFEDLARFVARIVIEGGLKASRTITGKLVDINNAPIANLTGAKWATVNQGTPDRATIIEDRGAALSTNATGDYTLTVQSTAPAGSVIGLTITNSDGVPANAATKRYQGPVTLS